MNFNSSYMQLRGKARTILPRYWNISNSRRLPSAPGTEHEAERREGSRKFQQARQVSKSRIEQTGASVSNNGNMISPFRSSFLRGSFFRSIYPFDPRQSHLPYRQIADLVDAKAQINIKYSKFSSRSSFVHRVIDDDNSFFFNLFA